MSLPEYTISLLIWIVPIIGITAFLSFKKILGPIQKKAIALNVVILGAIGCGLDLLFAKFFFVFPNPAMTLGIEIWNIPIEEFVFYVTGFWCILLVYVFCDEYFLVRYNRPDEEYRRYAKRLRRRLYLYINHGNLILLALFIGGLMVIKHQINPQGSIFPGYAIFLAVVAYFPFVLFWRLTRRFINFQAMFVTFIIISLVSILWEVTLAFPRGYWNYNHDYMLGIFISFWNNLPIEELTLYVVCTLIILTYEYTKIAVIRGAKAKARSPRHSPVLSRRK